MFINFKLKVEEAQAQGIDTTAAFVKEYDGYRAQLVKPYLVDKSAEEAVLLEAYERMKEDLNVSHILVRVLPNATAADTLAAWNKIKEAERRIEKEDFAKVAVELSEDPTAKENSGHLGWITAFTTIYPFETVAYATPAGEVSKPARSSVGYHLIKVNERRPTRGEVLASHIMLFTDRDDETKNAVVKQRIDSLYQCVLQGENFEMLASTFSEDRGSAISGGKLPWFGTGRMVQEFEQAAFALKDTGEVSAPIRSPYGWHIIKLLDKRDIIPFEEAKDNIEQRIKRDERSQAGAKAFIEKLKKEYAFQQDGSAADEFVVLLEGKSPTDSTFLQEISQLDKPLFSFADRHYSQADFSAYLRENARSSKTIASEIIRDKLASFVSSELLAYEDTQLGRKHPDLHFLSQEYHDGILLFEVSNREVWEKASRDVDGLADFFKTHRKNYAWDKPHYKGKVIYCKDEPTMQAARLIVKRSHPDSINSYLNARLNDSIQYVKVETGLFVEGDNPVVDEKVFKSGKKHAAEGEYPYVFLAGKLLKKYPDAYTDVRGLVTADYQTYLEGEWVKYLREKYPVVVHEDVLATVEEN